MVTHRPIVRLLSAPLLALIAVVLTLQSADAGISWCRADPKVQIGSEKVDILVAASTPTLEEATGPILLVIRVPVGTLATVLETDLGFGQGYTITIEETADLKETKRQIDIEVAAYVPATKDSLPILLEVIHKGGHAKPADDVKHTNKWLTVRTKLKKG